MTFQPGPYYQAPPPPRAAKPLSKRPWLLALIGVAGLFVVLVLIGAIVGSAESEDQQPAANRVATVPSGSPSASTSATAAASSSAAAASSAASASAAAASSTAAAEAARQALIAACGTWNADYLYAIANNNPSVTRVTQAAWEATWTATQPATCVPSAPVTAALATARATAAALEDAANRPIAAPPTSTVQAPTEAEA